MASRITAGIDVGSNQVKVVIAELGRGKRKTLPTIIGTGSSESRGLRHGYIVNSTDTIRSIKEAVSAAEQAAETRIKKAYLSIGGVSLEEIRSRGEVVITRADSEISNLDIERALAENEKKVAERTLNRKIIHVIPLSYKIDGQTVLGKPQGMKGSKLLVETLFITYLEQHLNDLIAAVEELGIEVEDVMAAPIAASLVTLTKTQKIAGCVLANIGSETVSIVVFENSIPQSVKVFPIGSTDITNDIALGLKISLEEAEAVKLGAIGNTAYPKKKLDDIISARLSDIFELIEAHLKKIGRNGLLPAGIILTGGGVGIATVADLARASLKLPSKIAAVEFAGRKGQVKDASWAVAYGLCIWGLTSNSESSGVRLAKKTGSDLVQWVKQFLP